MASKRVSRASNNRKSIVGATGGTSANVPSIAKGAKAQQPGGGFKGSNTPNKFGGKFKK